jgi:hypothetical protein
MDSLGSDTVRLRWVVGCSALGLSFLTSILVFSELLSRPPAERLFEKVIFDWVVSGSFQTLTEIATEKNSTTIFPVPIDILTPFIKK